MSLLATIDWTRVLQSESDKVMILGFFALMAILAIEAIFVGVWQMTLQTRVYERMVERGFSPEEIISVINAGEDRDKSRAAATRTNAPTTPPNHLETPVN